MKLSKEKIFILMAKRGLTVAEFAEKCQVSKPTIARAGRNEIRATTAYKIAKALKVDMCDILED